ncbi:lipoprotein-releasing ABC transporter permease subunit [Roseateles sp. BYS180W]|uniref:Lipoprotein-releasing ABC transporter permease subunit n=1 Tax=Roseateles rivi TaxID=3299028 RepID=A0ABW7FXL1_9BURK
MNWPYELQIGWRYTRAGQGGRRNRFISFISGVSVLGIALGVAALIIVLSVMNGFQKEVRDRMLSVVAHVEISSYSGEALEDWQALAQQAKSAATTPVRAAAPFVTSQVLVARGEDMRGALLRGIEPEAEAQLTDVAAALHQEGLLQVLQPGQWNIILGVELARQLGVQKGDQISVVPPSAQVTPAGVMPRVKQFRVAGVFSAGHFEYDSGMALVHARDAAALLRTGGVTGVQLRLADVHAARQAGDVLAGTLGPQYRVRDWTRTNAHWYDAVQVEKRMMGIILTLIVAVAAFNLVSSLVMSVTEKQADIAILRTLGASPRSIMCIFITQGALAGVFGTLSGVALGLGVATHLDVIVPAIERLFNTQFLPASMYLISHMPSDPRAADIVPITLNSLALSLLATLYPSWRASRVQPAEALRYE